ncbi:helix-turn-helix domain-containing protein [Pseudovibrio sp. POLY-S9]|uniref:winged helix-turn-helix transcriptional regulator n=1 Tax=Pseudovibrio sp. POLY-S9 TaxID=1576596 RepID=UPI00070F8846|nr:helix-turn-helix domain-containing protein [Pseudovibrio sp. POLY-S9]
MSDDSKDTARAFIGYETCPVRRTLTVLSGKWKPLIIYELLPAPCRFNELKRRLPGVSQRLLTAQLRSLEEDGIVDRKVMEVVPPHVEYSLSEKGRSLQPVLQAMETWGENEVKNFPIS